MEANEDKNPIVIDEVVNLDFDGQENKAERAEFAFVVFHNLAETYPEDADLRFQYTLTPDLVPTTRDWVGLYKVGWMSPRDYLYYEWAPVPENYKVGCTADASVVFPASKLPNEDGEFYQLCYVSSSSQIRGASTPFQFRRAGAGDEYVEVEDDETNMLVIRSKTAFLEENLQQAEATKIKLSESVELLQRERDEIVGKHKALMKKLAAKDTQNTELGERLTNAESQVAQARREARDMILVRDELQSKIDKMKLEQANLENSIGELMTKLAKLTATMKTLQAERDELSGKNTNLNDQVAMYKQHFETSETTVKAYSCQSEELQVKMAQQESLVDHLRQTVENLTRELEDNRRNLDQQTAAHKDNLGDVEERLKNAEDKLSAAEDCKAILQKEISTYQETQAELSRQIEKSRGECASVKQKLCVLEEDFTQKNKILETEMEQTRADLVTSIQEKEKLQGEASQMKQQLASSPDAMTVMRQTLSMIKERLEKKEKHCKSLEKSLMTREHEYLQSERDMRREIEDLKEKIVMCSEEYKVLYIEKNKLQRKHDKMAAKRRKPIQLLNPLGPCDDWRRLLQIKYTLIRQLQQELSDLEKSKPDRMAESMVEMEAKQMTSTPVGCETPQDEDVTSTSNLEPLHQEIDRQVEDLEREMERGLNKKLKYKNLYRAELERHEALVRTHSQDMEEKNAEIRRLRQRLGEVPGEYEHKVRTLEKCVAEKLQEIELLNQKLRQYNQNRNDEAGASTVPTKYGATNESKYPYAAVYSVPYPPQEPSRNPPPPAAVYNPFYVYPQGQLTYPHPPSNGHTPMSPAPQIPPHYPMQMTLAPLQYPAHESAPRCGQMSDRTPIQRVHTEEIPQQGEDDAGQAGILDSREQEVEALEQPLTPLPPPLEPEVLPSAKVAAVKGTMNTDDVDGPADFLRETNLKVVLPSEPVVSAPSAPPAAAAGDKEDRFYDAEGPSMKICTVCQQTFSPDVDERAFQEHLLQHVVGQPICPFCHMAKHEDMSDDHFERHVNQHMDQEEQENDAGVV